MKIFLPILIICVCYFQEVHLNAAGAPDKKDGVCKTMTPFHEKDGKKIEAKTGASPIKVIVSSNRIKQGEEITVTLKGDNMEKFKGFYVQVRDAKKKERILGTFVNSNAEVNYGKCGGADKLISATHKNGNDKDQVVLKWKSPTDFKGGVFVMATIVIKHDTFHVAVLSEKIKVCKVMAGK